MRTVKIQNRNVCYLSAHRAEVCVGYARVDACVYFQPLEFKMEAHGFEKFVRWAQTF